jgi:hypothetical protein
MPEKGVQANIRISDTARPKMISVSGRSMRNRPLPRNPGSSATTPTTAAPIPCSPIPAPMPANPVAKPAPTANNPYNDPASATTAIFLNPPLYEHYNLHLIFQFVLSNSCFQEPPDMSEGTILHSTAMIAVELREHLHIMQPERMHEGRENSQQEVDEVNCQ